MSDFDSASDETLGGPYADIDGLAGMEQRREPEPAFVLRWGRLDTETSFSDWTIVIEEEGGKSTTYHVHKCVLAAGNRKSDYFTSAFKIGMAESLNSTSRISLDSLAAAAFPVMLDYMYMCDSRECLFTDENALPLRFLANHFLVRSLFLDATKYIQKRFRRHDVFRVLPSFLKQAALFQDEILIARAADACASNMQSIDTDDLLTVGTPLFTKILSSSELNCPSEDMSTVIAKFCNHYAGEMDWATLKAVTREEVIPEINPDKSMFLLNTCLTLRADAEAASDSESWHVLHDRCIDACVPNWKETILVPLQSVSDATNDLPHRQLPPPTQVALLEKALCEAGLEVAQLQEELAKLKLQCVKERPPVRF